MLNKVIVSHLKRVLLVAQINTRIYWYYRDWGLSPRKYHSFKRDTFGGATKSVKCPKSLILQWLGAMIPKINVFVKRIPLVAQIQKPYNTRIHWYYKDWGLSPRKYHNFKRDTFGGATKSVKSPNLLILKAWANFIKINQSEQKKDTFSGAISSRENH